MANELLGVILGISAILIFFVIAVIVFMVIVNWKLFVKAGKPGWASIVPVYNAIVLLDIIGYKWYYIFMFFASFIPMVGSVILLLFTISYSIKLSKSFGMETGFGIGLCFLYPIFAAILAFNKNIKYVGPKVNGDIDFNDLF